MDPRSEAADHLLRRLGIAIKTFSLYPPQHPTCVRTLEALNDTVRPYLARYGAFTARISKHAFTADGVTFGDEALGHLALQLYTRKLSQLTILPAVSDEELATFLPITGMDRLSLEAAGGVEHLLWQAGVASVQVTELTLEEEQDVEALGLSAFLALIGRGRLGPREREAVLGILHQPDQTARLLQNVYLMAPEVFEGIGPEERVAHTGQAIRTLDRLILDEPLEDQGPLYASLAEAVVQIEEPLRAAVTRVIFSHAQEDATATLLLRQLSPPRLAEVLSGLLPRDDVARQLATFLRVLSPSSEQSQTVVSLLEERLRPPGAAETWLSDGVRRHLQETSAGRESEVPSEFVFDDSQIAIGHEEFDQRVREAKAIDEAETVREVIKTLVDLFRHETDEEQLADVAETLNAHIVWMLDHQEFALLARVLGGIQEIATAREGGRQSLARGLLLQITESAQLDHLLAALWGGRDTPVEREVRACLEVLADEVTIPLIRVLGLEPRAGMRALLCDLLVSIGRDKVDELGAFVADERWYLVRNIVNILGRLLIPRVTEHLGLLVTHPEYRVRREVVDALARVGTKEAQTLLLRFLDDTDTRLRLRALQALNAWGARQALPRLVGILESRDPLSRHFSLRHAALEAVERVGAREALPVLRRLARNPVALGPRRRVLRDLARRAVAAIEGQGETGEGRVAPQVAGSRP